MSMPYQYIITDDDLLPYADDWPRKVMERGEEVECELSEEDDARVRAWWEKVKVTHGEAFARLAWPEYAREYDDG